MKAAVLRAPGQRMDIEDVRLDEPRAGEVLVRLVATGVCHTDYGPYHGDRAIKMPVVLGHEGAGVVEAVGPSVSTVAPGDHVVLASVPRCGKCGPCVIGRPYVCEVAASARSAGTLLDGTTRLHAGSEPVAHFFSQSSFAEQAVVPEGAVVCVPNDAPLDKLAVLACGVSTGLGAVFNAASLSPGASMVMFGCGGVGLGAIIAADLSQAETVIAVDLVDEKLELARSFGATHTINAGRGDAVQRVRELTGSGVEYAFEFVGNTRTVEQAVQSLAPGGHAYIVGGLAPDTRISFPAAGFLNDKHVHGVTLGSVRAATDIPRYAGLYKKGRLPLDRLVTRRYSLEEVNAALDDLETASGRGVICFT